MAVTIGWQVADLPAVDFRVRAREHFDTVWINYHNLNIRKEHSGIGPNLNFWMEEPYQYSIGLSYSHMFIDNQIDPKITGIKSNMELVKVGIEWKNYLYKNEGGIFTRLGISNNSLRTQGSLGELKGNGFYLGLGWEFKFSQIGLAFEAAGRKIFMENDLEITTYSPSIGVHFYGYI